MSDRRKRLLVGCFAAIVGALTAAGVYWRPEQLHAPAWVAYAACAAFVFAGVSIVALESGLRRIHFWLIVAVIAAMLIPGAWVAFGPGVRECTVSLPFFSALGPEFLCRGAFGVGAVMTTALLVWIVMRALRQQD
jgi:hypothetical protein